MKNSCKFILKFIISVSPVHDYNFKPHSGITDHGCEHRSILPHTCFATLVLLHIATDYKVSPDRSHTRQVKTISNDLKCKTGLKLQ